ncbi:hypothetical protein C5167_014751 [Papaver somniferum]|uniref:Uncharacterized protein n=1 Tax=Papaver somniferum TaxID=3469 RepID=A0A4Y7J774_PAPSO|nr:hypothetical protein C5167_014751 [Papaver somniferum]
MENTDDRLPIFFNEHGQWNGPPNFATLIGEITRSKIGLGYAKLKEVPLEDKEDVWNSVQNMYQVITINKKYVLAKENSAWRTEKSNKKRSLNDVTSVEEKKRKLPAYNKKEDWGKFINNISDPKWLKKFEQAAEARSNVKAQYTGGRKGVPTRWNELEKESPTGQIYRPDVFLKTHRATPDDDPSSSKSQAAAKLASSSIFILFIDIDDELVKEAYDKDPSAQKCLGTDAVTEIYGTDQKGYIRGMGAGISKSQFLAAEFMKAKLLEVRNELRKVRKKNEALKAQLDAERQKNGTGVHGQIYDSSYQQGIGIPSSFCLCCLRNFRKKVVALAYVDMKLLIDEQYDCMIEEVIDPTAMLCDRDDDVVLGNVKRSEFVKWPKAYDVTWSC